MEKTIFNVYVKIHISKWKFPMEINYKCVYLSHSQNKRGWKEKLFFFWSVVSDDVCERKKSLYQLLLSINGEEGTTCICFYFIRTVCEIRNESDTKRTIFFFFTFRHKQKSLKEEGRKIAHMLLNWMVDPI